MEKNWFCQTEKEILEELKTDVKIGLSSEQVGEYQKLDHVVQFFQLVKTSLLLDKMLYIGEFILR